MAEKKPSIINSFELHFRNEKVVFKTIFSLYILMSGMLDLAPERAALFITFCNIVLVVFSFSN